MDSDTIEDKVGSQPIEIERIVKDAININHQMVGNEYQVMALNNENQTPGQGKLDDNLFLLIFSNF